ncbi:MAG: nitroreductase [Deltaproteobacteria bacterium RIFOXYD12_FULL_57_12]|nr:MAG: nitroreductase [Deltaproteobacteria bacterium RIFOXYD12_FULL_57_12]
MDHTVSTAIDAERCSGCGQCLSVCPSQTLAMGNGTAVVRGSACMQCGHCQAICPTGAITIAALEPPLAFTTFASEEEWLPAGACDTGALVRLMRSRRSCRNFLDRPIASDILTDLARIGTTAPSGTNSQQWTFTILASRQAVILLGNQVAAFFKKLNRLASCRTLRLWSKLFGNDALGRYYRGYFQTTKDSLREWETAGKDRLFHGAPAAILVGASAGASCPMEDALLATQNILLAAHAMGLGSCLIGFAVEAIKREPAIKKNLDIPADESIYAVIALGYPDECYQRVAGRRQIMPRLRS